MDVPTLSPKIKMNIPEDNANVEPPSDPVTSHKVESSLVRSESSLDVVADAKSPLNVEGDPKDAPDAPDKPYAMHPQILNHPWIPEFQICWDLLMTVLLELTDLRSSSDQDVSSTEGFRAKVGFKDLVKVILNNYALLLTSNNLVNIFNVTCLLKDE
jgi:hypothetical protein